MNNLARLSGASVVKMKKVFTLDNRRTRIAFPIGIALAIFITLAIGIVTLTLLCVAPACTGSKDTDESEVGQSLCKIISRYQTRGRASTIKILQIYNGRIP